VQVPQRGLKGQKGPESGAAGYRTHHRLEMEMAMELEQHLRSSGKLWARLVE